MNHPPLLRRCPPAAGTFLRRSALLLAALFVPCLLTQATLVGPYPPDANTLYLLHFDGTAGSSVVANAGLKGGNFITATNATTGNGLALPPTVTTLLGYAGYTNPAASVGFTGAVSGTNIDGLLDGMVGYDGNGNGVYDGDVQNGQASPDAIAMTNLNIGNTNLAAGGTVGGNSPFTLEALVCPATIISSLNQEIICSDSYHQRGFQFKITTAGQLQFNFISAPSSGSITFAIPTTGPDAFVPFNWYHVAVTYDGTNVLLYWTALNPTNTAAHPLGTPTHWTSTSANGAVVAPLVIGAENRGSDQESFQGLVDEVRISSVARAANQMQFYSTNVTINVNPVSQNIDIGQPVTFTASATSLFPIGYQWRFNGAGIPNATNTSYSIAAVDLTNAGSYDVVVTNTLGSSSTSSPAILVVGAANFLAHRWSFNTDTSDSIGGATGTNFGNAVVSGGKLVLDGTTGTFMQLPANIITNGMTAVTFDFWASYGINSTNVHVFDFGNTNFQYLGTGGYAENYVYFSPHTAAGANTIGITGGSFESEQNVTGTGTFDGQTVHVTCVVDPPNQTMAIYTNGVLEAVNTNLTVSLATLGDSLSYVGRSLNALRAGDTYLNAGIDELRIYNGALNATSVQQSDSAGPNGFLNDGPVSLAGQPVNTTTAPGLSVTFSGSAVGLPPITYQWFESGSLIPNATNSSYSFIASSGQNGHTFQLVASNIVSGVAYSAASSNATLTVLAPVPLTWLGANGNTWDTSTLNWTNLGTKALVAYGQYDQATFNDLGSGQPTVNLAQSLNPLGLTVDSTASYTFVSTGGNGLLTGDGSLTKNNTGTLVIDVTNLMTGAVTISGGTLQIGNNDTLGAIASPVTNNASLVLDRSDATTLPSPIYGSGTVTLASGNVTASGSNYYTGATFINNGVTFLANSAGLGATNGAISVANGAELYLTANVDFGLKPLTLAGSGVSSAGALRKGASGVTTYYGPISLAGDATLAVDGGATLNLTNSAGLAASSSANLTLNGSGAGNITGPLSLGSGALTVGGGTWTVAPSNNFSGLITLNAGTLRLTGTQSVGPVPASFNPSQITLNGGALEAAANITLNDGNIGLTLNANSTLAVDAGATLIISNQISSSSGALSLTKSGPGALVLNGPNTFNGTLNVDTFSQSANDGMVDIANNSAIAGIPAVAGVPFIIVRNQNAGSSTLGLDGTLGAITVGPDLSLNGRNNATPQVENLAGNNTVAGNITLGAGGGNYIFQSDNGTLTLSALLPYATPTSSSRILTFTGNAVISASGGIQDGSSTGTSNIWINVLKTGTGTLVLPAANTYSGLTTISNGFLQVDGSIGSGGVIVSGGRLGGTGAVNSAVNVQFGAALAAGDQAVGTLTVNSNVTLSGNVIVAVNKSLAPGATNSFTTVNNGGVTNLGTGAIIVTNLGPALAVGDSFQLFNQPVVNGGSLAVVGGGVAWNNNLAANGTISVASTTLPHPVVGGIALQGTNLILSGSNGYTDGGFYVLSATNLALPLAGWTRVSTNVFGAGGVFSVTNSITSGAPLSFYAIQLQ